MSERYPNIEGGACADLAPGVAAKYFDINTQKQVFERQTAIAICGHCVVRAACLEASLVKPDAELHGVTAGLTPVEIRTLKQWRSYDLGTTDEIPSRPRPALVQVEQSHAASAAVEYRRTTTLTFDERVRGVFLDLRSGKYNETGGISQAIGAIAFIREQMDANAAAGKRAAA